MDGESFGSAQDHINAISDAEAASRKAESEAMILRSVAARSKTPDAYKGDLDEKEKAAQTARDQLNKVNGIATQPDLSGVTRGLSDSAGNFAANTDVLQTGGIGVEASNTNVETGKPATDPENAGVVIPTGQAGTTALVAIPDGWADLSWQERRSLAAQFSTTPIKNSDEANTAIQAELDRRG